MTHEPMLRPVALRSDHIMLRALIPSVGTARRFVRGALAAFGYGDMIGNAELVTSELVTNSINAVGDGVSWVTVSIYDHRSHVLLEVWDSSPERPVSREAGADATHGRGLLIVEALSTDWGVHWPRTGGKTVWSEMNTA